MTKGAFTPYANEADKSRYLRVVGRLNILSLLASFAREIHEYVWRISAKVQIFQLAPHSRG